MNWRQDSEGHRERDVSERKNCEKCRLEVKEENSMAGGVVTEG